ncbi:diguanylate cyclase (GGDEF) domain-containing protein [Roseateles sp. YR242]|uniref:sensor domain-containing diguanylate cyclase n=1 Tax=Roseateles sp. YR242 TaxID=1855305 RepID=UPI0008BEC93D|nr:sensor domain-containing diguanylate cyclase [Roseateles sp. YR242]SEL28828.1 diguanylate cyclase (GGDEF) domain-containing protein [Roseateles sp. YR242]
MISPPLPPDENVRLATLRVLQILDTGPDERFDRITRMAKRIFQVPIALVSLVDADRQWFKSAQGLAIFETPRDISFCGHAILSDDILLVPDSHRDPRFVNNPLVTGPPHVRFYAGCPVRAPSGHRLGTLCLIDQEPRGFDLDDQTTLRDLAYMVEQQFAGLYGAMVDELTGLANRRGFDSQAGHVLALCQRKGLPATLLFFDLDRFKQVNDHYGHAEGDWALKAFADLMRTCLRSSDVVARNGGDEFVALLSGTAIHDQVRALERLQIQLDAFNQRSQRGYALAFSVGSAAMEAGQPRELEALMAEADAAMYRNKQARQQVA